MVEKKSAAAPKAAAKSAGKAPKAAATPATPAVLAAKAPQSPAPRTAARAAAPAASAPAAAAPAEIQRLIAEAAYYRAEKRGFASGDPLADWLEAEREIAAKYPR